MAKKGKGGPLQRFFNSIFGMLIGVALFLGSFVVLWINEGRVDLSKIGREAERVPAGVIDPARDGALVAVSGVMRGSETLGDPPYLRRGDYMELIRVAEMYAWDEEEEDDDDSTTYTYRKIWTTDPEDSSRFNQPAGHTNPPMAVQGMHYRVAEAWVGDYPLDAGAIFFMDPPRLSLTTALTVDNRPVVDGYIFLGKGTLANPEIGDIRLSYEAFPANSPGTVFGRQEAGRVVLYHHDDGETLLYRAYATDFDGALAAMRTEYLIGLWLTRGGGFLMMWIGLLFLLGPVRTLLDFIPLVGRAGNFLIALLTLLIAFFFSLVTIIVSAIAHNLIALIVVLLLLAGGILFWRRRSAVAARAG